MAYLSRIRVNTRLVLIVALALLALSAVTASSLWAQHVSNDNAHALIEGDLAAVQALSELNVASGHLRRYEKDMLINLRDAKAVAGYEKKWTQELAQAQAHAKRSLALLGSAEADRVKALADGLNRYGQGVQALLLRLKAGEFADTQAANRALEPVKASIRVIDSKIDELVATVNRRVSDRAAAMEAAARRQLQVAATVVTVSAALLLWLALGITRSITRPLAQASQALGELAQGDLSRPITARGSDELAQMMRSLAQTQQALRGLVQTIQGNAESVATASGQIAQGNLDLSSRTEQQASSLQQTAAAMEELTGTVRSSSEHARRADQLARETHGAAERGGGVVANVVQTMDEIQAASRRIGEITGVIDGIAFQTNILALNAAVEAARAGEQGRGFAVVASEVRLLAQRSAEAARQIKGLIGDSIDKVEAGGRLVHDAGLNMAEVVRGVQQVSELVSQITAAAQEQHTGIEQVGHSISLLDRTTQQNAALVEESAAAADSLRGQARQLNAAVGVFRLAA